MADSREPFFQFVLNHSQELIFRYDCYGCIKYANERVEDLTGYKIEELQGIFIGELFKDAFIIKDNRITLAPEYQGKDKIETVIYRKNRTCFPVDMILASMEYAGEEVYFCMSVDMTSYRESIRKLEEKTEQVRESMKSRDTFVANVTHELRTPVNGIKGNIELLMEQENDAKKAESMKMIRESCATMEGIINNILDFSKLEAGKFQLDETPFSFYGFMEKMEKNFTALAVRKGLRFMMNIADNVPDKVIGDELRLTQILNNLVSNAIKFTSYGYVGIEVTNNTLVQDEVELFFMVVDTGIGLSKEDKDKLFKSFSQVDASITRKYGGTGLGLSITKELVNMMHGDIWAEGEKGKGSSFSFTIHLKLQESNTEEESSTELLQKENTAFRNDMEAEHDLMYEFGNEINEREIRDNFVKMNLSADMDNWYKAENYAEIIKKLLQGGSKELQRVAFRMEMAVRKSDYDRFRTYEEEVKRLLKEEWKKEGQ